jgi:hypothetical protein
VMVSSAGSRSIALQLSTILLTPPISTEGVLAERSLTDIRSVDAPLLGNVAVSGRDVSALPYVGMVDSIGNIHPHNAVILQTRDGFVIRGSVSHACRWVGLQEGGQIHIIFNISV